MGEKIVKSITGLVAGAAAKTAQKYDTKHQHIFHVVCKDVNGNIKWEDDIFNLVTNEGLDEILDQFYSGSAYTAAHYLGLTDGTPSFAEADTMSSHAGWAEVTAYDEAVRQTLTWAASSGQSKTSDADVFTIDTNSTTIGGAFITTVSTKGGTTGTLIGGGAFSAGDKTLDDNDTLTVTVFATAAAA